MRRAVLLPYTALALLTSVGAFVTFCACVAQEVKLEDKQYKRVHIRAMQAIVDGNVDGAIEALHDRSKAEPDDVETYYALAVAFARKGDPARAFTYAKEAEERGFPLGRFFAGPRRLLAPLLEYGPFQEHAAETIRMPVHGPLLSNGSDGARVWVRTARETDVTVEVSADDSFDGAVHTAHGRSTSETDYTVVAVVHGLDPGTEYCCRIQVDDGPWAETTTFRTFPEKGKPAAFRIGFGGGAGYTPQHERMWNTVLDSEPRAFMLLGDNVYIDHPEYPDIQQYCYYRRQSRPEFRQFAATTPIFAIYDDHDFGDNDCWGGPAIDEPEWKRPVWRIFKQNWANSGYGGGEAQPGCWFKTGIADVDFFFMDCRYYRTDPKRPNPSMLGRVQKGWLLDALARSNATFKVIASSVPMASGTKPGSLDTWDGYADEREEIFSFLEERRINGVLIISADRHRSDLWRIERPKGYDLYEFNSSRLTNIHVHKEMKEAVFSYNEKQSYGLIDFDTTLDDPTATYAVRTIDGETKHTFTVRLSEISHPAR